MNFVREQMKVLLDLHAPIATYRVGVYPLLPHTCALFEKKMQKNR